MTKEVEIIVTDGEQSYSCKLKRPDIATLSRVNKLSKSDEVLAAQELLKGCWISGDAEIQSDAYLMMAVVGKMSVLQEGVTAELKN
ncbi:MAG: hypothetical protein IJU33_00095 [Bacteroidales bacterium]|nr:hypothetical protein [Bacteroidales bacterium]